MEDNYKNKLYELLAVEYNCKSHNFKISENLVTVSALKEGRRRYGNKPYFFQMVTTGDNAVITADEELQKFLTEFSKGKVGRTLFEIPNLIVLNNELDKYGMCLTTTYHMFLPKRKVEPKNKYHVKWFYDKEIHQFYKDERFPNAILDEYNENRPDTIVVCAYDGNEIMGMAGCSEDAPGWCQIGIDVLQQYRERGVATYLVTLLKDKIMEQGKIPFYGTTLSNYGSWNVAINSGFAPAWVEIGCTKKEDTK